MHEQMFYFYVSRILAESADDTRQEDNVLDSHVFNIPKNTTNVSNSLQNRIATVPLT